MATTGCGVISGSGDLETHEMDFTGFTKLEVGYAFDAEITRADSFLVKITIDDNLYQYLDISQNNTTLRITMQPGYVYTWATQRAVIHLPDLERLELSGASRADVSDFTGSHTLDIEISGASQMDISDVSSGEVSLEVSGASKVNGSFIMTDAIFELSGASSISLEGSADDIYLNLSGASRASLSDFKVANAEVDLSGASNATVNASGLLSGGLSGASKLKYVGNPTLGEVSTSGGSSINPK
jgi:Tfp pilus assembly protein PilV